MRKEIPNRDDNAQVVESLKSEIEIMKRILSGLVASMETIARDKKEVIVSEQKAKFPYPVQVTSDKAHLREGPHRGASSLTTVEKNTVLLVIAAQDEWLKVFTPKGEEAWISADIVSERRE
jgi:SH3-like domain-containing protein